MITLDLSILNQKGTPMFFSDLTANRPAAGIVGRIFIATDSPYGIFRDTGTGWDQVSGAGSFSGSLATGQVAFGSATNTISGSNNLFWDAANSRLGIGTNVPNYKLTISDSGTLLTTRMVNTSSTGRSGIFLQNNASAYSGLATYGNAFSVLGLQNNTVFFASHNFQIGAGDSTGTGSVIFSRGIDSSNETMRISGTTGNVIINSSITDGGQRLQVYGDAFIKGSDATSATFALSIQDSAGLPIFRVRNDNKVFVNQLGFGNDFPEIVPTSTGAYDINGASFSFIASQANYGLATYNVYFRHVYGGRVNTSGTSGGILQNLNFTPTSGTGVFNHLALTGNINQTGGANGISRGLYVSPVITAAADFRSIQWDNNSGWGLYGAGTALNYLGGTLGIKTTSPYAPSTFSLDVNGGLLVKNTAGTTAQITLINADPSLGGNNGFLVASVGGTSGGSYVDFQGYYGTSIVGSTALRLNSSGGAVIVNSTTNSGEQFQLTGSIRVNGQTSPTSGGVSGQHLIVNCDGVQYKIELRNP